MSRVYLKKITIEQLTQTVGAEGGLQDVWAVYCRKWARVKTFAGRESFEGQRAIGKRMIRFSVPWDREVDAITAKMRVVWEGRTFDIHDKENVDERNREVLITCLEMDT